MFVVCFLFFIFLVWAGRPCGLWLCPSVSFVPFWVPFCILFVYFLEPFGSSFSIYLLFIDKKKKILIPGHVVMIILIIELNMPCINVLICTHNLFTLIIAVRFNFGANLTVRSSLNCWDQSITVGSSQDLKFDCWISNLTVGEHSKFG